MSRKKLNDLHVGSWSQCEVKQRQSQKLRLAQWEITDASSEILVPLVSGIYLLYGKYDFEDFRFYIGQTTDIVQRFISHRQYEILSGLRMFFLVATTDALPLRERRFIAAAQRLGLPLCNSLFGLTGLAAYTNVEQEQAVLMETLSKFNLPYTPVE
jgi:hypothetical protein